VFGEREREREMTITTSRVSGFQIDTYVWDAIYISYGDWFILGSDLMSDSKKYLLYLFI